MCFAETIYPPVPSLSRVLIACTQKTYAVWGDGVLCRDFAAHRCYEETIQPLLASAPMRSEASRKNTRRSPCG